MSISNYRARRCGLISCGGILALLLSSIGLAQSQMDDQFHELQRVIEANCAECLDASESRFKEAVHALKQLIDSGYQVTDARELLADSYGQWAVVYAKLESAEYQELRRKQRDLYQGLLEESPLDASLMVKYARAFPTAESRLPILESAHAVAPEDPEVAFALGGLRLNALGDIEGGLDLLEKAFQLENSGRKLMYGQVLVDSLRANDRDKRAVAIEHELREFIAHRDKECARKE